MEKNIYKLLNEIEMDLSEYEDLELSPLEKESAKQRILREVKSMEPKTRKNRNRKRVWMAAAGTAAACALVLTAIGIANPTLAENLFSDTFGKLIDNARGEKNEEEKTAIYSKIGEKSVEAEAELARQENPEEYSISAEDNGVTISVSDIYCDGYVLYYTASLTTEREDLNQSDGILIASKEVGSDILKIEGMDMSGYSSQSFEKTDDHLFVSAHEINLLSDEGGGSFETGEDGTIVADWTITNLTGKLWDSWDAQGEYESTGRVEGTWHLRFPVTVDTSKNETFAIDQEANGIVVKDAVKTKAGLVVHVHLPDFRKEPYNDPYNDPYIGIKNADGSFLQWMAQRYKENADGTTESWIMVLYNGEKELYFEASTKEEDSTMLAEIGFQIP